MKYTVGEIVQFIKEEDVKFVRLAFCDVFGTQKNISILADEVERAFNMGIAIDASAIKGFCDESQSDLFLRPDPNTLTVLPWRPEHGRVVRMFCDIYYPDGKIYENDTRNILKKAVESAEKMDICFQFGAEMEFYLFKQDENGNSTKIPFDNAGYLDIAPLDKGENVRREICLTLEQMDIHPESSHHEEGKGQNEIDFKYSSALESADNTVTFRSVVQTIANRNGVCADFSPKPLSEDAGNGFHINFSVQSGRNDDKLLNKVIAGILNRIEEITLFLNPSKESYKRLGKSKAPLYISWSPENRSQLIRVPSAKDEYRRAELRSPDPLANPYVAFTLLIYAGLEGIRQNKKLCKASDINFYTAKKEEKAKYKKLPCSLKEAVRKARESSFVKKYLPKSIIDSYSDLEN